MEIKTGMLILWGRKWLGLQKNGFQAVYFADKEGLPCSRLY